MQSIVTASGVSFELPNGRTLLTDINFSLNSSITALIGPNGVGKSCLAKLLTGELQPTRGAIRRHGPLRLFQQRELPDAITVDEYLALDYEWSLLGDKLLKGIHRQALCTHLSGGEWMRARLARSLSNHYTILDEPTNDLDRDGREALLEFLRECPSGVLLISHDRECLELCKDVLELSNQGLAHYGGGWSAYADSKEHERQNLSDQLDLAKRNRDRVRTERVEALSRQEKRSRRGAAAAARGGMPKILIGARKRRAQVTTANIDVTTQERADSAVRSAFEAYSQLKVDPIMYADIVGQKIAAQKLVAEARGFNIRFQDWLYNEDLSFAWRGNIRLALKGGNGSGKSTLLKAILGEKFESRGELRTGGLNTLYIDQRCASLDDNKNVFNNIRDVGSLSEDEIRNSLAKFLFIKETVFQQVSTLSGGERLRAALARGLLSSDKPELLILDEPTNNLDLGNIEFLENLVREFRGALIVISHDEVFLRNCGITEEKLIGLKSRG